MKAREQTIPKEANTRISEALERLVELYTSWHAAEPDMGHDAQAAEWQKKRNEHAPDSATEEPATTTEE